MKRYFTPALWQGADASYRAAFSLPTGDDGGSAASASATSTAGQASCALAAALRHVATEWGTPPRLCVVVPAVASPSRLRRALGLAGASETKTLPAGVSLVLKATPTATSSGLAVAWAWELYPPGAQPGDRPLASSGGSRPTAPLPPSPSSSSPLGLPFFTDARLGATSVLVVYPHAKAQEAWAFDARTAGAGAFAAAAAAAAGGKGTGASAVSMCLPSSSSAAAGTGLTAALEALTAAFYCNKTTGGARQPPGFSLSRTLTPVLSPAAAPPTAASSSLGPVNGVLFDPARGLLRWQRGTSAPPLPLDPHLLACALRLVYFDGRDPVFSLDPWPFSPDGRRVRVVDPSGPHQIKVFDPPWLAGTAFGEALFLADYELKRFALGARKAGSGGGGLLPAGWRSALDFELETAQAMLKASAGGAKAGVGSSAPSFARVWFSLTSLRAGVQPTEGGGWSLFLPGGGGAGLKIEARQMVPDAASRKGLTDAPVTRSDSSVARFVAQCNAHLQAFLAADAAFTRLNDLVAALALAKALHGLGVPIDAGWVTAFSRPVAPSAARVVSVRTTGEASFTAPAPGGEGGTITTRVSCCVFGGVSLEAPLQWEGSGRSSGVVAVSGGVGARKEVTGGATTPLHPAAPALSPAPAPVLSWALLQRQAAATTGTLTTAPAASATVLSPLPAAAAVTAKPPPDALAFVLPPHACCAACGEGLLWTTMLTQGVGESGSPGAVCSRPACVTARAAAAAAADKGGGGGPGRPPSPSASTVVSGGAPRSVKGDDADDEEEAAATAIEAWEGAVPEEAWALGGTSSGDAPPRLSPLVCYACGFSVEAGQPYLTLTSEDVGQVALHTPCIRCEAASSSGGCGACGVSLLAPAAASGSGSVTLAGRFLKGSLLCAEHAGAASGLGGPCAGCGGALWRAPGSSSAPFTGAHITAGDGTRYHAPCFVCAVCRTRVEGAYYTRSRGGGSSGEGAVVVVCLGCKDAPLPAHVPVKAAPVMPVRAAPAPAPAPVPAVSAAAAASPPAATQRALQQRAAAARGAAPAASAVTRSPVSPVTAAAASGRGSTSTRAPAATVSSVSSPRAAAAASAAAAAPRATAGSPGLRAAAAASTTGAAAAASTTGAAAAARAAAAAASGGVGGVRSGAGGALSRSGGGSAAAAGARPATGRAAGTASSATAARRY